MGGRVSLALVIHNHQPVGNFGWVIEDVYERAYGPLLGALERHPGIHIGLHYTGPLLDWLRANQPDAVEQIRRLAARGQVEIVGGAYYEPILPSLPDRDRHGQLTRMRDEIERLFGHRPNGAWLAERVWEPSLPFDLAAAGYGWTVLDDAHLRAAAVPEDEMWTAFTTDDRGLRLTVFGTEQGLRYRIPFKPVEDVIEYLRARRTDDGRFVGVMGDDGEKFGAWPGTFEYCWSQEHWVDRLFEAIERNADWLSTVTPSSWLAGHPPTGRVYVPDSSYLEMTEWALPAGEAPTFTALVERARAERLPEARFLRGGFWRNFAARYREINELHKQMLRVSAKVEAMADGPAKARALDHLYQGQSNDCYWHGLFGGIYIVHMRMATLAHLIAAEDVADLTLAAAGSRGDGGQDGEAPSPYGAWLEDTNLDAVPEILVATPGQTVVLDLADGAGISSWDLRASRVALTSVLRRRPEAYHKRLVEHERALSGDGPAATGSGAPRTIHEIVMTKEPGLAARLHYDHWERRSGLVHLLPLGPEGRGSVGVEQLVTADFEELGDFVDGPFELVSLATDAVEVRRRGTVRTASGRSPVEATKRLRIRGGRLRPELELMTGLTNGAAEAVAFELAVEWNVNLLGGGHNPSAYYESQRSDVPTDTLERSAHDGSGELPEAWRLAFGNDYEGVRVEGSFEPAARLSWYPVETVSNSEAGFERVYQGSSLLARWAVRLEPGESRRFVVRFTVRQAVDRTAQEEMAVSAEAGRAEGRSGAAGVAGAGDAVGVAGVAGVAGAGDAVGVAGSGDAVGVADTAGAADAAGAGDAAGAAAEGPA